MKRENKVVLALVLATFVFTSALVCVNIKPVIGFHSIAQEVKGVMGTYLESMNISWIHTDLTQGGFPVANWQLIWDSSYSNITLFVTIPQVIAFVQIIHQNNITAVFGWYQDTRVMWEEGNPINAEIAEDVIWAFAASGVYYSLTIRNPELVQQIYFNSS